MTAQSFRSAVAAFCTSIVVFGGGCESSNSVADSSAASTIAEAVVPPPALDPLRPDLSACKALSCGAGTVCEAVDSRVRCVAAPNRTFVPAKIIEQERISWSTGNLGFTSTPFVGMTGAEIAAEPFSGDFDSDRRADIAWYNRTTGGFQIWWGQANRTFTRGARQLYPSNYRVFVGDFDGSGTTDIAFVQNDDAKQNFMMHNNPDRTFSFRDLPRRPPSLPFACDVNQDHIDDICWYDPKSGNSSISFGKRDRTFLHGGIAPTGRLDGQPLSADFDGDGVRDLAWYSAIDDEARPIEMKWSGFPPDPIQLGWAVRGRSYRAVTGDFNGDGRGDIFWNAHGGDRAYFWTGTGRRGGPESWFRSTEIAFASKLRPLVGDFDGDGLSDILWVNKKRGCFGDDCFDAQRFVDEFDRRVRNSPQVSKFSVAVTMQNGAFYSAVGGMARRAPDSNPRTFSVDDRIDPASVTKLVTAIAMLKALEERGMDPNRRIGDFLPRDWVVDPSFAALSIRSVLSHTAGLRDEFNGVAYGYRLEGLQLLATRPPSEDREFRYQNINYALMRVVLAGVTRYNPAQHADQAEGISAHFLNYINQSLLAPIGIAPTSFTPDPNGTLYYPIGDLQSRGVTLGNYHLKEGTGGIQLSSRELSKLIHELFRGRFISSPALSNMLEWEMGLRPTVVSNGVSYAKGGFYPERVGAELHTRATYYPSGAAVFFAVNGTLADTDTLLDAAYHAAWF